jgi:hypothetical protein
MSHGIVYVNSQGEIIEEKRPMEDIMMILRLFRLLHRLGINWLTQEEKDALDRY